MLNIKNLIGFARLDKHTLARICQVILCVSLGGVALGGSGLYMITHDIAIPDSEEDDVLYLKGEDDNV